MVPDCRNLCPGQCACREFLSGAVKVERPIETLLQNGCRGGVVGLSGEQEEVDAVRAWAKPTRITRKQPSVPVDTQRGLQTPAPYL